MDKTKTVYISGKMTGEFGYEAVFADAVFLLRENGWRKIINPCCLSVLDLDYEQYMTICFAMIDASDVVYMLGNWKESPGAQRELSYALAKRKEIIYG